MNKYDERMLKEKRNYNECDPTVVKFRCNIGFNTLFMNGIICSLNNENK